MNPAITAKQLTVAKKDKSILKELDFTIQKGSLTGLIGPSGAGKTTLIRSLVGIQRLTGGKLTVLGLPAGDKRLRSRIGYVTQSPSVYADLTVRQNIEYFTKLLKAPKGDVSKVIKEVHLEPQADQVVSSLSGGQHARVSLAVALIGNPELLVLDEPTVGLDPLLRQDLWQLFKDLADSGRTLIISSHVMDEAERCQNVLLLRDGQLLWRDSKQDLLRDQQVESVEQAFLQLASSQEES